MQWDQRGSGKTCNANDPEKIGATLSLDRRVKDRKAPAWAGNPPLLHSALQSE